jgi:hypothetical protein
LSADVHVITPQGDDRATVVDGAFTVHFLGNTLNPAVALRRSFLIEALVSSGTPARPGVAISGRIGQWLGDCGGLWDGGTTVVSSIDPDLVMIAGHRHSGLDAVIDPELPYLALPLCTEPQGLDLSILEPNLARAFAILTTSKAEHTDVVCRIDRNAAPVHDTGLLVPVNPSVGGEPPTELAEQSYILVLSPGDADLVSRPAELARLLALRLPNNPVAVIHDDALVIWRRGEAERFSSVARQMDLWRLMAWARCTVDLRPDPLLGYRSLESMLLATPIVVPEHGRAHQHAASSDGGLWYTDAAGLIGCVEALLEGDTGRRLGEQGRRYASEEYGSPSRFVEKVGAAVRSRGRSLAVLAQP